MSLYTSDADLLLSEYTSPVEYEPEVQEVQNQIISSTADLFVKPYPIPRLTVTIPLIGWCSGWVGRPVTITWDSAKTTVTSSRLVVKVTPNKDPVALDVNFNNVLVKSFFWGEGTKGEQSDVVDVSIINGTNIFEAKGCKHLYWVGMVGFDVDAYVEVTFEGEIPERPWWEVFQEWLSVNWPYLAIGTGLVIMGGSAYMYLARPGR